MVRRCLDRGVAYRSLGCFVADSQGLVVMTLSVADILSQAADLVERAPTLLKGDYDHTDHYVGPPDSPECFCAIGAIRAVVWPDPDDRPTWQEAQVHDYEPKARLYLDACSRLAKQLGHTWGVDDHQRVTAWNDQPDRTQGDVVQRLQAAAARLRAYELAVLRQELGV